ncbi:type II toxin-antitoxin system VapB family antitoxin [Synoicihabitans lomoniglobus]|uniref:Type II toxin-antitoxin system VapB family antitoxin n=1 Tax=Synoicihabitans lomoniglobus TaxID=2909285 RepID=A0AAF0CNI2_9BACT|nr:type II toxin-antitoxin system VapB family antitoxin [Opitutaceae bacterium LMO-M01]WED65553.1 type II toxin-antitoxin system VapB family antitoxin [Opitutaceae bacterium LMO-M01]
MKMTMHIDEDVLAEVMDLTGAKTKTAAVEMALRDLARRHKQRKLFRTPLWPTHEDWVKDSAPQPSDAIDPPDIDEDAVQRCINRLRSRRQLAAEADDRQVPEATDEDTGNYPSK